MDKKTYQMWVKLFELELDFITNICNNISDSFWKNVLLDWERIVKSYSQYDIKVLNEHLWFNPNIRNDM